MNPPRIEPLCGPFAWDASALDQNGGWSVELDTDEITCLDDALDTVVSRQIGWSSLTKARFPLPVLSQKLEAISTELEDGCGMVSLRGISPGRLYR